MSVGLHCRLARPGRVAALAEFLDFVKSYGREVWICTREEMADFWYENHSPKGAGSLVQTMGSSDGPLEDKVEETSKPGELVDVKL